MEMFTQKIFFTVFSKLLTYKPSCSVIIHPYAFIPKTFQALFLFKFYSRLLDVHVLGGVNRMQSGKCT